MEENTTVKVRICVVRPDKTELFRTVRAQSRRSMVISLKSQMTQGKIIAWRIYDDIEHDDFYWQHDQEYGSGLASSY